ncbi:NADPH-dependent F420 reductase [Nocardia rhizosphaerihabitans]|uniref:3-hydroxyisobutyrate dehydrogenase n=1 Tax=Nocardia rhizosphaerihabitans TaxID=1691570 RepID=A0ABQ2L252_9NOCA|nr:NAD(P)-binding domain-containing protein [Nocardia rhizosphaerihabitans]GGN99776.1 3-hydroxyisobutyrate dehydrogenase [Nocardia rhizosphaerihabitans]
MRISVIGAGAIGGNIARRLAESGHEVLVADARGPQAVAAEVRQAGARAVELDAATQDREVIVLSIPFAKQPELADLLAGVSDETVIVDTSNYYPVMNGHIEAVDNGQVESVWSAEQLGKPIVKAWNAALAGTQQTKGLPTGTPGRIAIPVAADSERARRTVMRLVDDTGFDPVDAGILADSWRQQPGTPGYCTELDAAELQRALAAADKDEAPRTRDRLGEQFASLTEAPSLDQTVAINRAAHHRPSTR